MLATCHLCEHRSCSGKGKPKCAGEMLCTVNGKNVLDNQREGCPNGLFGPNQDAPKATPKIQPIPYADWPTFHKTVAAARIDGEEGTGDTLKRCIHLFPDALVELGAKVKAWLRGEKSCGCERDRKLFNARYNYSVLAVTSEPARSEHEHPAQ